MSFGFLRFAEKFFKIMAVLSLGFFVVVSVIVLLGQGGPDTPRIASLFLILAGGFYFVFFFTIGEVVRVLLAVNEKVNGLSDLLAGKPSKS